MDMIQLAGLVAAQQEKRAMDMLLQGLQVGYPGAQPIFFNPLIARGSPNVAAQNQQQAKPPTSLFVGNISEKCNNEFIQKMLEECGKVLNWKRIKGSHGKFQAFGFCDFENPEGTMRALRVLHEFQIGDKKLNLKADDKMKAFLREYWTKKKAEEGKSPGKFSPDEIPSDEEALKVDEEVRLKILNMIEKDYPNLLIIAEDGECSDKEKEAKKEKERKKEVEKKDSRSARRRSRSRSRSTGRRRRTRSRSPKHKKRRRHSSTSSDSDSSRSRSRSKSRSSRSRSSERRDRDRKRSRSASRVHDSEDSDDARERKALKKKLKEKEQNYVARLKKWESRERRIARAYEKEEQKEQQRRRDVQKEAKKLRHFLEDYDDEKDDLKYYKSGSLFQRKREFEREKEQDAKDRQREQQEIEEVKKELLAQNKDLENVEEEAKRLHKKREEEALRKLREDSGSPNPHKPLGKDGQSGSEESSEDSESGSDSDDEEGGEKEKTTENGTPSSITVDSSKWKDVTSSPSGLVIPSASASSTDHKLLSPAQQRPDLSQRLNGVFGMDDDETSTSKKMKPFEISKEERMSTMTQEERKKMVKDLIAKIPTSKDDLFSWKIDWQYVDQDLISSRIRPWVSKKINEYIGEEEKSLVDFVCEKVAAKTQPDKLLKDIAMILDDEAEVFVVKMWRLLIFESESNKMGLLTSDKKK